MNTLGVVGVYSDPGINLYFIAVLTGILRAGMSATQSITVFSGYEWADVEKTIPLTYDGRCDGLLLIGAPDCIVDALVQTSIPFVLINEPYTGGDVSRIDVDNVAAAKSMVEYLFSIGHRRIAIFRGDEHLPSAHARLKGYLQAHENRAATVDPALVFPGTYSKNAGDANARLVVALPPEVRPTAVFCSNDAIAIGALKAFDESGILVPEHISVAGFDDIVVAELTHPRLTTVRQPLALIGERAAGMLLEQIEQRPDITSKEVVPTQIVVRGSTRSL